MRARANCACHSVGAETGPPPLPGLAEHRDVFKVSKQQLNAERVDAELDELLNGSFSTSLKFVATNARHRLAGRPVVAMEPVEASEQALVGTPLTECRRRI